jgi:hypothetical protein
MSRNTIGKDVCSVFERYRKISEIGPNPRYMVSMRIGSEEGIFALADAEEVSSLLTEAYVLGKQKGYGLSETMISKRVAQGEIADVTTDFVDVSRDYSYTDWKGAIKRANEPTITYVPRMPISDRRWGAGKWALAGGLALMLGIGAYLGHDYAWQKSASHQYVSEKSPKNEESPRKELKQRQKDFPRAP